jgi:Domain of unknown function (DUF4468) with TBP-like fold
MKSILIVAFSCLASICKGQSQELPVDDKGEVDFTEVVHVDSANKDKLYRIARAWFANTFTSANKVLEMDDKDAGMLIGKAYQDVYYKDLIANKSKLWYTIKVYLKDNRYRYEITDMFIEDYPGRYNINPPKIPIETIVIKKLHKPNGELEKLAQQFKDETIRVGNSLSNELKEAITKSSKSSDDW